MKRLIVSTWKWGTHRWPDAPPHRAYLRESHCHKFRIIGEAIVTGSDREREFHDIRHDLDVAISKIVPFGTASCEHIADLLLNGVRYLDAVSVYEDESHGARVTREDHPLPPRPRIVTVCGSTKFKKETLEAIRRLEEKGIAVFSVGGFPQSDGYAISGEQKAGFDLLHQDKIRISDGIYVVNPGGYIGESTRKEIELAERLGISIEYLTKEEK
jgi:hypothetical protein